jgi:anaerobic selenocysteine-containing dehydrogenase
MGAAGSKRRLTRRGFLEKAAAASVAATVGTLAPELASAWAECQQIEYIFRYFVCIQVGTDCYGNPVCEVYGVYDAVDVHDWHIYCFTVMIPQGVPCACP